MEDVSAGQGSDHVALLKTVHANSAQRMRVFWVRGDGLSAVFVGIWMLRSCSILIMNFCLWRASWKISGCVIPAMRDRIVVFGTVRHGRVAFTNLFQVSIVLVATHPPGAIVYERELLLDFTPGDDSDEPPRRYQTLRVQRVVALVLTDIAMSGAHDRPVSGSNGLDITPAELRDANLPDENEEDGDT